ncbi:MAG: ABC transporter ATP-binding protein/permease [Defluviitaleaceae bacterium]|nr:ABC transporter ATP-binding protein/permease [Defluviitaleaceae bacterium]
MPNNNRPASSGRKKPVRRPAVEWKTVRRLFTYITGAYKLIFVVVFLSIAASAAANVIGAAFVQRLIDDYITPLLTSPNPVFTGLLKAILFMGAVYLTGTLCTLFYNRVMVNISQGILKKIRDQMFAHMQNLPIRYYDTHTHGDMMSLYTNDTDTLRDMISQSIPQALSALITIISVTVAMLLISVWLSLLVFACVVIMLLVVRFTGGRSAGYFVRQQSSLGDLNGYIEEMIDGQKVIKVFCHEKAVGSEFDRRNDELCRQATQANTFANITMPIMGNIGNAQYVLIAMIGGAMALHGVSGVTLGAIASFLTLSKSFSGPISQISTQINFIVMSLAGAGRIFNLLDEKAEADDGYVELVNVKKEGDTLTECGGRTGVFAWRHPHAADGSVTLTELKGDVRLSGVDFGYSPEKLVLHDISLFARPGEKIAFVGATGAGKTTITNLLNRFYDIADGKIRVDDININKIKKSSLRRSMGIVLQDVNLFTGTVADNIRYGKPDATQEEVERAARTANAHDFITRLPQGYDTMIDGGGGNLSQGQRQLISIARAAACDPPILIMDEATSSIDTRTEALVARGMDALMEGRTVFVIAHRLSTIQNADAIMVLENGRIIERGDHEALLREKGKYYQLYTGALGHE